MISHLFRGKRVHLVGIGGAGVSALVPLLNEAGAIVSGCDCERSLISERLRRSGLEVHDRHDPQHAEGVDLVVHTAAVAPDHPELAAARARGIEVIARGECLVRLMHGNRTVAIAGSHGKTSTTWMTAHLLLSHGLDPVVMVGGAVGSIGGGGRVGQGDIFVAETDESDGSFARIRPDLAVVTNLDREHLRHYGSFSALESAFQAWLASVPADGLVVLPTEGISPAITSGVVAPVLRVGLESGDYHAQHLELGAEGSRLRVIERGLDIGEMQIPLPGAHMALNALMALALARRLDARIAPLAMATCERVRRRFTVHGTPRGVRVVEDYGHHPTEVRATIAAARLAGGRVHVLFQPHRPSRTADLWREFIAAFDQAHALALLPIYAASEPSITGVTSQALADAIAQRRRVSTSDDGGGQVLHADGAETAIAFLAERAGPGDTVLVLGAGDVGAAAPALVEALNTAPVKPSGWLDRLRRFA